jgi:hypothetical protein
MFARFNTAWQANSPAVAPGGSAPVICWPYITDFAPPLSAPWARVWNKTSTDKQRSLGRPAIYTVTGFIYVDVFCPANDKQAANYGRPLAQVAHDAYVGVSEPNGLWYRNTMIKELSTEVNRYCFRVSSEYSFDYLK